jgi:serine/threonine-protein kinase
MSPTDASLEVLAGGRYRLRGRLRAGGMAIVHRAWDRHLEREVAVKTIAETFACDLTFVRRFRREAELSARLAHPHVVTVLDAGSEPRDFIVMELMRGLDARALLKRRGWLTSREAIDVVAQVSDALAHVHAHGVIHGDVSLGNVLIGWPDGTAKLADFGLASTVSDSPAAGGGVIGTPGYVAPEVLLGATPSARSDLYSLGVAAYRLLVGASCAWPSDRDATVPLATARPRTQPLDEARPDLPRGVVAAIEKALSPDPAERNESVAEFRSELTGDTAPLQPALLHAA